MNKKQRILRLYDTKRTPNQIAEIVGCRPEYVRVLARKRKARAEQTVPRGSSA